MSDPDIAARLRDVEGGYHFRAICCEAADEIERLREDVKHLRKFELEVTRKAIQMLPSVPRSQEAKP